MKILLTINPSFVRSGYKNICPIGGENIIADSYINLDAYADNGEVEELVVIEALEYLDSNQVNLALENWFKKLAYSGTVIIEGTDLRRVCDAVMSQKITSDQANKLLFGSQANVFEYKKSTFTMNDIALSVVKFGFQITKKRLEGFRYSITAVRNG